MESPTIKVFSLGTFRDFMFFKGPIPFNFLFLLLFGIACKLSSRFCECEGLNLLFIVKSILQVCKVSRRVLSPSCVWWALILQRRWEVFYFSVIFFIIWVLIKFSFLRIHKMCSQKFEHATEQVQHATSSLMNKLTLVCPNLSR